MWPWLKKNFLDIKDENLLREIQRIVEDEDRLKKRKQLAISKFEDFLKTGGALSEGRDPGDEVFL